MLVDPVLDVLVAYQQYIILAFLGFVACGSFPVSYKIHVRLEEKKARKALAREASQPHEPPAITPVKAEKLKRSVARAKG